MHAAPLLIMLAQFDGFSRWTDAQGVGHVVASNQAPAGATIVEGGSYSVIDADGRPQTLPDGGARTDDSAWWRGRFQRARLAVQASDALERAAATDLYEAQREQAERALRRLEQEALAERVPLRDWY